MYSLVLVILFSCVENNVDDSGHKSSLVIYGKYLPYSTEKGNLSLFNILPENQEEDPEVIEEPQISLENIDTLIDCNIPTLNLAEKVITTSVEWFVFSYCVLNTIPKPGVNARPSFIQYRQVFRMDFHTSAYYTMLKLMREFLEQHASELNSDESRLAAFERFFLITQFRMLTLLEKERVEEIIHNNGFRYLLRKYLVNWLRSDFYADHFDFSKDPQPTYFSYEFYGNIVDENDQPLDGISYQPLNADQLNSLHPSGVTKTIASDIEGVASYNFHIQFYSESLYSSWRSNPPYSGSQKIESPLVLSKEGSEERTVIITSYKPQFHGIRVVYSTENMSSEEEIESVDWPEDIIVENNYLHNLSYRFVRTGNAKSADKSQLCKRPEIIRTKYGRLIDGYEWQEFIHCYLGTSPNEGDLGLNHESLSTRKSALDLMFLTWEHYSSSQEAINISNLEKIIKIYELLRFRSFRSYPLVRLRETFSGSLDEHGLEQTIFSLLDGWYNSTEYSNYFDYSHKFYPSRILSRFSGIIKDHNDSSISSARVTLESTSGMAYFGETFTDDMGMYDLVVPIEENVYGAQVILKIAFSGYATGLHPILLDQDNTEHVNDINLTPIGMVMPQTGGMLSSEDGEVSVFVPSGAVDEVMSFRVSTPQASTVMSTIMNDDGTESEPRQEASVRFEILPDHQFKKPVGISISFDETIKSSLGITEENTSSGIFALFSLNEETGKLTLIEDSNYNPNTGVMTATTDHFSVFVITACNRRAHCLPRVTPATGGTIFEPHRFVSFPVDLISLKREVISKLERGGWDASSLREFDIEEEFEGVECNIFNCSPLTRNFSQRELNIPMNFSERADLNLGFLGKLNLFKMSVGSISLPLARSTATADMEIQAEQCLQNPLASFPQIRINSIQSIDGDFNLRLSIRDVRIKYPDFKIKWVRVFGIPIFPKKISFFSTDRFSHDIVMSINNIRQMILRDSAGNPNWRLGPGYNGNSNIDFGLAINSDVRRRYRDEFLNQLKSKTPRDLAKMLGDRALELLDSVNDPMFDEVNCPSPPKTYSIGGTITGLERGVRIVLQNNKADDRRFTGNSRTANGEDVSFSFNTELPSGSPYSISISEKPDEFACEIRNGEGQVRESAVRNIRINCNIPEFNASDVGTAGGHNCAINNGVAYCWGANYHGQLGDGTRTSRSTPTPTQVVGLTSGVSAISVGNNFTCAIHNGVAKCWGSNRRGQLGIGVTGGYRTTPQRVIGLTGRVVDFSLGGGFTGSHACALVESDANHELFCWGYNNQGQLGDGTRISSNRPKKVDFSRLFRSVHSTKLFVDPIDRIRISEISAGSFHTCAEVQLPTGIILACWGINHLGQLGDGTRTNRLFPTVVKGNSSIKPFSSSTSSFTQLLAGGRNIFRPSVDPDGLSAGSSHTCAVSNGTAYCWGYNANGHILGHGEINFVFSKPKEVSSLGSEYVSTISTSNNHTCAIQNGAVKCWGANRDGRLGDNSTITRTRPVNVFGISSGATSISLGFFHTCAVVNGTAYCWGDNSWGQLGNPFRGGERSLVPIPVHPGPDAVGSGGTSGEESEMDIVLGE